MTEELDQLVDELVDVASRFLADRSPVSRVINTLMGDAEAGFDRALWKEEAELGWTGLTVSEALGGSELGYLAQGRLLEACGGYLAPEPFLSTVCLAIPLLVKSGAVGESILKDVVAGNTVVSVALPDDHYFSSGDSPVNAKLKDSVWQFSGEISFVLDYPGADWVLVPAKTDNGLAWFAVSTDSNIVNRDGLVIDGRASSRLNFDSVSVGAETLLFEAGHGIAGYQPVVNHSAALLSSWMLGMCEQVLSVTRDYLCTREQYGALIGSYQALQHRMATLYSDIQVARSVIESALQALDDNADDAEMLASAAKARAGELVMRVTAESIQMHGGIGMTEEAGIGLYYKAARVVNWLAGSQRFHHARAAGLLGIKPIADVGRVS